MNQDRLRSPLAKVRGLGSAKDGTGHWWMQRITAIAMIPLSLWFVYSLMQLAVQADRAAFAAWVASPAVAITLILMFIALFNHARLGLQVVIEDYIHSKKTLFALLILNKFIMFALMVISIIAVLKIHLFSANL